MRAGYDLLFPPVFPGLGYVCLLARGPRGLGIVGGYCWVGMYSGMGRDRYLEVTVLGSSLGILVPSVHTCGAPMFEPAGRPMGIRERVASSSADGVRLDSQYPTYRHSDSVEIGLPLVRVVLQPPEVPHRQNCEYFCCLGLGSLSLGFAS